MRLLESLRDPFVTVLAPRSEGALALAKSILDSAGIPYQVRCEKTGDLFGWGRLGAGINYVTGPVRVVVRPEDADAAKEMLSDLTEAKSERLPLAFRIVAIIMLLVPILIGLVAEIVSWSAK